MNEADVSRERMPLLRSMVRERTWAKDGGCEVSVTAEE